MGSSKLTAYLKWANSVQRPGSLKTALSGSRPGFLILERRRRDAIELSRRPGSCSGTYPVIGDKKFWFEQADILIPPPLVLCFELCFLPCFWLSHTLNFTHPWDTMSVPRGCLFCCRARLLGACCCACFYALMKLKCAVSQHPQFGCFMGVSSPFEGCAGDCVLVQSQSPVMRRAGERFGLLLEAAMQPRWHAVW